MASRAADLAMGFSNEEKMLEPLSKFLKRSIRRRTNVPMGEMDYEDDKQSLYAELKSRRIRSTLYDTALVGANKVAWAANSTKPCYFFWAYTDGVFYLQYEESLWKTFTNAMYQRGQRTDCIDNPSPTVFVPRHLLKKVEG